MNAHTTAGSGIISSAMSLVSDTGYLKEAQNLAAYHHERWDGKGYPRGISDNEISLYAQIVSVVDVYDALTSKRAYKEPWDRKEAEKEILSQKGTQFSPRVVDAFIKSFDKIQEIQDMYVD
jgi:HD-GYP domain-containing protein (c-di-GMP phosphodiesterase class II)